MVIALGDKFQRPHVTALPLMRNLCFLNDYWGICFRPRLDFCIKSSLNMFGDDGVASSNHETDFILVKFVTPGKLDE